MPDVVADAYATMATFRLFVRNSATTDATDADTAYELMALEAAARAIETFCNRKFEVPAQNVSARYFTPLPDPDIHAVCYVDDFFSTTSMTVAFDTSGNGDYGTATTAYRVAPYNAASKDKPYTHLVFDSGTYPPQVEGSVKVEALWGWTAIPKTIENANLIQAARFLKRRDAAFGVAGSPEMGNELRLLSRVDPDVAVMLAGFKRYF